MMCSATVIVLFASFTQAFAAHSVQSSEDWADELVHTVFNRAGQAWPLQSTDVTDLEGTTLEKASQLAQPRATPATLRAPLAPSRARAPLSFAPPSFGTTSVSSERPLPISRLTTRAGVSTSESIVAPKRERKQEQMLPLAGAPEVLVSESSLILMEKEELLNGQAVGALRRFSDAMEALPSAGWESRMRPCFAEMALNLESFNPVFTACLLQVQMTAGQSDYERRDQCLQRLIQPLAGEYGLHAGEPLGKTHRALFREWFESVLGGEENLQALLQDSKCKAPKAEWLFQRMISDVETAGQGRQVDGQGSAASRMEKAAYALGYNLAVEYLANPEKTWLLESFRKFDQKVLVPLGRQAEYEFLVVHAIGEKEHANLGHEAAALFVPASLAGMVRQAMRNHDRDLAEYYNHLADILEGHNSAQC